MRGGPLWLWHTGFPHWVTQTWVTPLWYRKIGLNVLSKEIRTCISSACFIWKDIAFSCLVRNPPGGRHPSKERFGVNIFRSNVLAVQYMHPFNTSLTPIIQYDMRQQGTEAVSELWDSERDWTDSESWHWSLWSLSVLAIWSNVLWGVLTYSCPFWTVLSMEG